MGAFYCRQPNNLLCRFSTNVDAPTHWNMTEQEFIDYFKSEAEKKALQIIANGLTDFDEIRECFAPNNITTEEFNRIMDEMTIPAESLPKKESNTKPLADQLKECLVNIRASVLAAEGLLPVMITGIQKPAPITPISDEPRPKPAGKPLSMSAIVAKQEIELPNSGIKITLKTPPTDELVSAIGKTIVAKKRGRPRKVIIDILGEGKGLITEIVADKDMPTKKSIEPAPVVSPPNQPPVPPLPKASEVTIEDIIAKTAIGKCKNIPEVLQTILKAGFRFSTLERLLSIPFISIARAARGIGVDADLATAIYYQFGFKESGTTFTHIKPLRELQS